MRTFYLVSPGGKLAMALARIRRSLAVRCGAGH
jgi:hypothetical protein